MCTSKDKCKIAFTLLPVYEKIIHVHVYVCQLQSIIIKASNNVLFMFEMF